MKYLILVLMFGISINSFGQEFSGIKTEKKYFNNGNIKSEINFQQKGNKKIREGKSSYWYNTGELKNIIYFKGNKFNGERISYWKNGKLKRKDFLKKGKLKNGKCFDRNGNEVAYYDFEIQPEFPGGKKALNDFFNKYLISNNSNNKGKLIIRFTIKANVKASDLKILKDTNPSLRNAVIDMFDSMPIWSPAKQDGIPVEVKRTIPVNLE